MIYFVLFRNGHFHSVISTLTDVVKLDVEKDNVVSTWPNFRRINVEIHNVDSMLSNVANPSTEMHNDDWVILNDDLKKINEFQLGKG